MTDQTDRNTDELFLQLFQNAAMMTRSMLANRLGTQFDGQRDLYKTFGYPQDPKYQDYKNLFDRQGLAARIVEKFANDTWNKPPILIDGESRSDQEDKQSKFIKEWIALAKRLRVYKIMREADIMLGFSRYSVIVMGSNGDLKDPVKTAGNLFYVQAFDEQAATPSEIIGKLNNKDFGLPGRYSVSFNSVTQGLMVPATENIHYSRVIHICEDSLGSRVYGRPRLQTILNRLFDIEKVTGGGAEAAWLAVYKGVLLSAKEGSELPTRESEAGKYMDQQIQDFVNKMQRYALLTDVDVHDLGVDSVSIKDIFDTIISDLAGSKGIPMRILLGSERGNQASTQDTEEWNGVINSRRTNFAEPDVLRPFVQWCIDHKVIAAPSSGDFNVEWMPVYEMSKMEEADYAGKVASAASTITGGVPEEALSVNEFRKIIKMPPLSPREMDDARSRTDPEGGNPALNPFLDPTSQDEEGTGKKKVGFSLNNFISGLNKILQRNTFEGHKGRVGKRGGSLPRGSSAPSVSPEDQKIIDAIMKNDHGSKMDRDQFIDDMRKGKPVGGSYWVTRDGAIYQTFLLHEQSADVIFDEIGVHPAAYPSKGTQIVEETGIIRLHILAKQWAVESPMSLSSGQRRTMEDLYFARPQNTYVYWEQVRGGFGKRIDPEMVYANTFEDHAGRPGLRGGSLPRGAGGDWLSGDDKPSPAAKLGLRYPKVIADIARNLGYDPKKVVASEFPGKHFMVGDQHFDTGGEYISATGEIFIYDADNMNEFQARGILAHEIQHDRWNQYRKALKQQSDEIMEGVRASNNPKDWLINADGSLKSAADKSKFWAYDLNDTYFMGRYDELRQADGITNYSRAYWKRMESVGADAGNALERAIDETLAEHARLNTILPVGEDYDIKSEWIPIYEGMKRWTK